MQTSSWVTMLVIMAIVWGGFAFLLTLALRKERVKQDEGEA